MCAGFTEHLHHPLPCEPSFHTEGSEELFIIFLEIHPFWLKFKIHVHLIGKNYFRLKKKASSENVMTNMFMTQQCLPISKPFSWYNEKNPNYCICGFFQESSCVDCVLHYLLKSLNVGACHWCMDIDKWVMLPSCFKERPLHHLKTHQTDNWAGCCHW